MAIDREETLRKAEKLLRQGRLDAAIAEYERVAESYPGDLATVDKLGDLYQRASRTADATTCYGRVADHWLLEGLHAKAATKYKKILKLTPDDEMAMLQLVEATAQQGLLDEAKNYLRAALDRRLAKGDARGADELTLKLADLDPNDFEAWLAGLKLRVRDNPEADLAPVLRDAMSRLDGKGRREEADALALSVIELDPDDVASRVRASRAALARGAHDEARALLLEPAESESYDIVLIAAELALRDAAERRRWLERLLTLDRQRAATDLAAFGERLVSDDAEAAYACIETLADHHAVSSEFRAATDLVTHFLTQSPKHLPALLRLVELCVDGDFEEELTVTQARLADVYLEVGQDLQAKVIAEDLLSRDPRSAEHRERLHRALVALGTPDPESVIAELIGYAEEALGDELLAAEPPKPPPAPPAIDEPDFGLGVTSPVAVFGVDSALDGLETPWGGEDKPAFQAADLGGLAAVDTPAGASDARGASATSATSDAGVAGAASGHGAASVASAETASAANGAGTANAAGTAAGGAGVADTRVGLPEQPGVAHHSRADESRDDAAFEHETLDDAGAEVRVGADAGARARAGADASVGPEPSDRDAEPAGPKAKAARPRPKAPVDNRRAAPKAPLAQPTPTGPEADESSSEAASTADSRSAPGSASASTSASSRPASAPSRGGTSSSSAAPTARVSPPPADAPHSSATSAAASASASAPASAPAPASVSTSSSRAGAPPAATTPVAAAPVAAAPAATPPVRQSAVPPAPPPVAPAQDDFDLDEEIDLTAKLDALAHDDRRRPGTSQDAVSSTRPGASSTRPGSAHVKGQGLPAAANGAPAGAATTGKPGEAASGLEAGEDDEDDLESFFESRREHAASQLAELPQTDQSVRLLGMAETYQAAGMIAEAEGALEQAAADPRYRFRAALALGRLLWREGRTDAALGWLGQASEAPAPTPEDSHAVLYELAERLEAAGETTRALAVLLDLVAEQEDYRDARERIDRLVRYDAEP